MSEAAISAQVERWVADFEAQGHDRDDPDPWLALFEDPSLPLEPKIKAALLRDMQTPSRQFLLPLVRPLARASIVFFQLIKIVAPRSFRASRFLHWSIATGLRWFVTPQANYLILRHFHLGSEILDFIARNIPGIDVPARPLRPENLDDLKDELFLKHDLNLFNFVISLGQQIQGKLNEGTLSLPPVSELDFEGLTDGEFPLEDLPNRWHNFIDVQTAIEIYTPLYQLFLSDRDFWRATNSLQLDETIALYVAKLLRDARHLALVNNKHPLVPLSTLRAGFRLLLHGLASEGLHAMLVRHKRAQAARREADRAKSHPAQVHGVAGELW